MTDQISQRTLGLLRRILEGMEPTYALTLPERTRFWKDQLFDFEFSPKVIEIAVSYEFRWGDIISDLFLGKFGPQNQHFSNALPPYFCEQALKRLLAFALHEGQDRVLVNQLDEALKREQFKVEWLENSEKQTGVQSKASSHATNAQAKQPQISKGAVWPNRTQQNILRQVVINFLKTKEPTSRISFIKKGEDPDTVDALTPVILRNPTGEKLFPTALAFQYCGDVEALAIAKSSVEGIILAFQELFKSEQEKTAFTIAEIEKQAREFSYLTNPQLGLFERDVIQLGLYLIQDFRRVHAGIGGVYPNITHAVVHERIGSQYFATAWDEHIEQYRLHLESEGDAVKLQEPAKSNVASQVEPVRFGREKPMEPSKLLKDAIKAVPAVRYALGIGGIIAVIAIIKSFGIDYRVAGLGVVIMLVLMTMLVIFARLAAKRESDFHLQAVIFTWFALVLTMATAIMLFSSVFWGKPLDLRYKSEQPSQTTEEIPPIVQGGGAPVGITYQYTYKPDDKSDLKCTGEYVKVSATDWQQRLSSESPEGCQVGFVVFTYTERRSGDPHYFLLNDASRNLLARITAVEKGQQSANEWRLVGNKTWNQTAALKRMN